MHPTLQGEELSAIACIQYSFVFKSNYKRQLGMNKKLKNTCTLSHTHIEMSLFVTYLMPLGGSLYFLKSNELRFVLSISSELSLIILILLYYQIKFFFYSYLQLDVLKLEASSSLTH